MAIKRAQAGVTLIELIVVIAIFTVVSGVLMFNYSDFNTNVSIRNLAQEIALSVRKAQTYATSVQSIDAAKISTTTYPAYGISFRTDTTAEPSDRMSDMRQFILFADIPRNNGPTGDRLYEYIDTCGTPSEDNECVESFNITSADRIVAICTDLDGGKCDAEEVNVMFKRPSPDADICVVQSGACQDPLPSYVKIKVESPKGIQKVISVWNTGQISVQ
jgi:prepilin-type N-terminal cleavage/methylation domain-containing protein